MSAYQVVIFLTACAIIGTMAGKLARYIVGARR